MNVMNKFFVRDVRCFDGEHQFDIRPLTFLIGENSTGKSTVLGCLQALGNLFSYRGGFETEIDFNFEPYQMGTFADIIRRSNPKKEDFQLGFEYNNEGIRIKFFLTLIERERGSEPIIKHSRWAFDEGQIIINESKPAQKKKRDFEVRYKKNQSEFLVSANRDLYRWRWYSLASLYEFLSESREELDTAASRLLQFIESQCRINHGKRGRRMRRSRLLSALNFDLSEIYSIAPIRSKPKRTYNPLKETDTPDGSEIPMTLMNLSTSSEDEWEMLRDQLLNFGQASGLFTDIALRKLGRSKRDPFQLRN